MFKFSKRFDFFKRYETLLGSGIKKGNLLGAGCLGTGGRGKALTIFYIQHTRCNS